MLYYLNELYESFNFKDLLLIFLSIVIGLIIGAEREYKSKTAGLRTLMLVCVGSCTFTILSIKIGVANPDRLAANIITGIGFLGAGAIFKDESKINGVTTACTIWVTAALGMCIGSGHIYLGLLSCAAVMFVLWALVSVETWIDDINTISIYKITVNYEPQMFERFERLFNGHELTHKRLLYTKNEEKITVKWQIKGSKVKHDRLKDDLLNDTTIHQLVI